MCGFAGILQYQPVSQTLLEDMGNTIAHRGPDYTGYYNTPPLALVHNRLSLLDLSSNGHQPYIDEDFILVYNGEIYNHLLLRKIHLPNQNFKSTSDTETLFFLLKKYGVVTTSKMIEGMFAFSWYNRKEQIIHLVRDRLGIKPLFYYKGPNQFVFSSELKVVSKHFNVEIDKLKFLSAAIGDLEYSRKYTAFENVFQIEPGYILTYNFTNKNYEYFSYFELTELVDQHYYKELSLKIEKEHLETFDHLFDNSVKSMLLSDVQMGAFVSGGIDSSIIAAFAKQNQPIKLFTSNVIGKYSELDFSRQLSKELNQELYISDYTPELFINDFVDTTWHYESPIVVHSSSLPLQSVAKLTKVNSVKAVLTGEGSDELFLGYPRLLTKRWDSLIKLPYTITNSIYKKLPGLIRYLNLNKNNYNRDLLEMGMCIEKISNLNSFSQAFEFITDSNKRSQHTLSLEMLSRGLHSLLWRNDRMGMMHSVEARFPFLNEELLKFSINLPINMKIGSQLKFYNYKHPFLIDKYIVRKTAETKLSKKLAYRKKQGFPTFGNLNMQLKKGFFKNGFVQDFFELEETKNNVFENKFDSYLLAKLACVEIWGRLFIYKEDRNKIKDKIISELIIK